MPPQKKWSENFGLKTSFSENMVDSNNMKFERVLILFVMSNTALKMEGSMGIYVKKTYFFSL